MAFVTLQLPKDRTEFDEPTADAFLDGKQADSDPLSTADFTR
jgi:hypothetical protein